MIIAEVAASKRGECIVGRHFIGIEIEARGGEAVVHELADPGQFPRLARTKLEGAALEAIATTICDQHAGTKLQLPRARGKINRQAVRILGQKTDIGFFQRHAARVAEIISINANGAGPDTGELSVKCLAVRQLAAKTHARLDVAFQPDLVGVVV